MRLVILIVNNYYIKLLSGIWDHLSKRRKKQFIFLLGLGVVSAFTEVIGLGAIFPFFAILVSPDKIIKMHEFQVIMGFFDLRTSDELLALLTVVLIVAMLIASAIRLLLIWVSATLSFSAAGDLSVEIYNRTLYQPYAVQISRNSSEIIAAIGSKVGSAMQFLHQAVCLVSSSLILVVLTSTLMYISSKIILLVSLFFGGVYFIISKLSRDSLAKNGEILNKGAPKIVKSLQEGLGGVRDILLDGSQKYYSELYEKTNNEIRRAQSTIAFINMAPRYLIEGLGFSLLALVAYWMTRNQPERELVLPILGAFALGAQRILPALQVIFGAWTAMIASSLAVEDILKLLNQTLPIKNHINVANPINFSSNIKLESVYFSYNEGDPPVLQNINLEIQKGERIGIVGVTGSGKSTLLDILMGLLEPTSGRLMVDGKEITPSLMPHWRKNIAHVPQGIYLADATIAENIALGVPIDKIDMIKIKNVAERAYISEVIELRNGGYSSQVGERGVNLSGGQRQRLAIARALYKGASVLMLDEATSALDTSAELRVMTSIKKLDRDLTVIIVAHREASIKDCDRILKIENGKLIQVIN